VEAAASNVHETRIATRWTDFDPLGHLTHSIVFDYFDEARTQVLGQLVGDFEAWPHVVVHVEADFRREVAHGASDLVVRTWVVRVGDSSVRFGQELLTPDGEVAVESEVVLVAFDPTERRVRPIGADDRARLLAV
jgi:YbgC/YbaW family acyl-CoA thioester hydrolase